MDISVHLAVRRQSGDIESLNKRHIQHLLDALKHTFNYFIVNNVRMIWKLLSQILTFTITFPDVQVWVTTNSAETLASNCSKLKQYRWVDMVVDDTLSMRIYSFIDNILINKTIKQIKQKIDFIVFCVRHLGLIVTAVTINGFTPVVTVYHNNVFCNEVAQFPTNYMWRIHS